MESLRSDVVYLDNACTTLKPQDVIDAVVEYYKRPACHGRSAHALAREVNERVEEARERVARFVNAKHIIWTKNATEALNLVINGFPFRNKKVVTTILEHHAVLLPLLRRKDLEVKIIEPTLEAWEGVIDSSVDLAVTFAVNNTTGQKQNIKEIYKLCEDNGVKLCVDGAQAVPHLKTDYPYHYLCFSAHKMCGPTGIGALALSELDLEPLVLGGGTVKEVAIDRYTLLPHEAKYEAGIQHYAGIFGFAAACKFLEQVGMEQIAEKERSLRMLIDRALSEYITYGKGEVATAIFNLPNAPCHEVALMLDKKGIAVRSGYFCAQPGVMWLGAKEGTVRVSAYFYNNEEDIKVLGDALEEIALLY